MNLISMGKLILFELICQMINERLIKTTILEILMIDLMKTRE